MICLPLTESARWRIFPRKDMRTSRVHYILPSALSIIPNCNGTSSDLAVHIVRGAKIKVYSPKIEALGYENNSFQEWTTAGRNRSLFNDAAPYTIYARLPKSDKSGGYLVFAAQQQEEGSEEWKDKYPYVTTEGLATDTMGADTGDYWWIKLGRVTLPEEGLRTVELDTGVLGTEQYNTDWDINPEVAPLRVVITNTINSLNVGQSPYVLWGQRLVMQARLVEGWETDAQARVRYWTIQRHTGDDQSDMAWNYPAPHYLERTMENGSITLAHILGGTDDLNAAVSATFIIKAWGAGEGEGASDVVLAQATVNVYGETDVVYDLGVSSEVVTCNPNVDTNRYSPADGVTVRIRGRKQDGALFYPTTAQITAAQLHVYYWPVGTEQEGQVPELLPNADGVYTLPVSAFAQGKSLNLWLENGAQAELARRTVAYISYGEKGSDGSDREYIYIRQTTDTYTGTLPKDIPAGEVNPVGTADGAETDTTLDDWVPNGWSDNMLSPTAREKYVYVSVRDKQAGSGQAWGPFSSPVIWTNWAEDGKDGQDGKDGEDGKDGKDGEDALTIELDTYALLFMSGEGEMSQAGYLMYPVKGNQTYHVGVRMRLGGELQTLTRITTNSSDGDIAADVYRDPDTHQPDYSRGIDVKFYDENYHSAANTITVTATCAKGTRSAVISIVPAPQGKDGTDGKDGQDGKDGEDGQPGPPGTQTTYELRLDINTVHYTVDFAGVRTYTPNTFNLSLYRTVNGVTEQLSSVPTGMSLKYNEVTPEEENEGTATLGEKTAASAFGTTSAVPYYIDYILYQGSSEIQRVRITAIRDYQRMLLPAGEYTSTVIFNRTDTTTPLVLYNGEYWFLNADSNRINGAPVAPSTAAGNPWSKADQFNVVLAKMLFADFARLGSFIVYENYFLSQYGTLISAAGGQTTVNANNVNQIYSGPRTVVLNGNGKDNGLIVCKVAFTSSGSSVKITLTPSSEAGYDKGAIGTKNSTGLEDGISGDSGATVSSGTTAVTKNIGSVNAGSYVYIAYQKDGSASSNDDNATFSITGASYSVSLIKATSGMTWNYGEGKSAVPYGWFDASDPMAETLPATGYKFRPAKVINALTGEEWMAGGKVHVSQGGDVTMQNVTIEGSMMTHKVARVIKDYSSPTTCRLFSGTTADTLALAGDIVVICDLSSQFVLDLPPAKFFPGAHIRIFNSTYTTINSKRVPEPSLVTLRVIHSSDTEEAAVHAMGEEMNSLFVACPIESSGDGGLLPYDFWTQIVLSGYQVIELVATENFYYPDYFVWAVVDAR